MPMPERVSAIVITYKRPDDLNATLANLQNQDRPPDEIVVVDNDPQGSGREAERVNDPEVRYFCPGENLGVSAGRNRAVAEATGDVVLFIDDDARFGTYTAINASLMSFRDETIACQAFLIRNGNTRDIVPKEYPGTTTAGWEEAHDVSYFLGGACAMRRQVFLDLGGFDETYFYGVEELDLSYRLINAGYRIRYLPEILVYHYANTAGRESVVRAYHLIRNRIYFAVKNLPPLYLLSHLCVWGGYAFLQAAKSGQLKEYIKGVLSLRDDGSFRRACLYRKEHPMSKDALAYLREHDGRLWY
jgi:GT2 family glycosyltransferase